MKLINVDTFELTETNFTPGDPSNKPYAILSHTWREDEVTYADMQTPLCRQKRGWTKIEYTCAEAKRRGLEWAWVDTCCIDKSSSSELSESINSMFRWYQEAAVCFVYLDDFDGLPSLKDCRWFERGWTLQELLAPCAVDFYDGDWTLIGTRDTMTKEIAEKTLIDIGTLRMRKRISASSVARRMSWASYRKTTRIEDKAYCLLGIFGVNMPLLYGEGTRAFVRLQEEILKTSDDHSILAWGLQLEGDDDFTKSRRSHGPLAPDPEEFRMSGDVVSTGSLGHYSMTNQGLEITLPVGGDGLLDFFFGLLGCKLMGKEDKFVAICLWPLSVKPNPNRYIRQRINGASTKILSFGNCLEFKQNTIAISSVSGITGRWDSLSPAWQPSTHQWLRLNMSSEFRSGVTMIYDNDPVNYRTLNRESSSSPIWWNFETSAIPDRFVFLVRLRPLSEVLFWVILENRRWSYVHQESVQLLRYKPIDHLATERSLDIDKLFNHPKLHTFSSSLLEPDNMLIRASMRTETIYNHEYTQVDLQYQEATRSDIAECRARGFLVGSNDQASRQGVFDSCCSGVFS
jgi:hypothetical protein